MLCILQKKRGGDAKIYSFEIPKWLGDMINETSIDQGHATTNPRNQMGLAPKIVDKGKPGHSIELPEIWSKWLEENAIPGSGKVEEPNKVVSKTDYK